MVLQKGDRDPTRAANNCRAAGGFGGFRLVAPRVRGGLQRSGSGANDRSETFSIPTGYQAIGDGRSAP